MAVRNAGHEANYHAGSANSGHMTEATRTTVDGGGQKVHRTLVV